MVELRFGCRYVLFEEAREEPTEGNDGMKLMRDQGNQGKTLKDFVLDEKARVADLTESEVLPLTL